MYLYKGNAALQPVELKREKRGGGGRAGEEGGRTGGGWEGRGEGGGRGMAVRREEMRGEDVLNGVVEGVVY